MNGSHGNRFSKSKIAIKITRKGIRIIIIKPQIFINTNIFFKIFRDRINDKVNIAENVPLNYTGSFSYGAWFKVDGFASSGWAGIMSRMHTWDYGYNLQVGTSQKIACGFGAYTNSNDMPSLDTWYYAVCVYDGTQMRLYVNGVLQDELATWLADLDSLLCRLPDLVDGPLLQHVHLIHPADNDVGTIDELLGPGQVGVHATQLHIRPRHPQGEHKGQPGPPLLAGHILRCSRCALR